MCSNLLFMRKGSKLSAEYYLVTQQALVRFVNF
ncbi:MAG: hypothetical protein ACJAXH_003154 [Colwellia sp.]